MKRNRSKGGKEYERTTVIGAVHVLEEIEQLIPLDGQYHRLVDILKWYNEVHSGDRELNRSRLRRLLMTCKGMKEINLIITKENNTQHVLEVKRTK